MTFQIKQIKTGKQYLSVSVNKLGAYSVTLADMIDETRARETDIKTYATKAQALRRFNYLKRQLERGV